MNVHHNLTELQIHLPDARKPSAAYEPFAIASKLVFLSGHTARKDGQAWVGKLGATMTTEEGKLAARSVAIDLLGTLQAAVGDLNRITSIVKLTVLVNSAPDFTEHHLVANGASELLSGVFGRLGGHARSAFGVAQVPHGACIEIEMIAETA
jgi:enamine deaminase RidA (YjgF/YER057c/UK114 family)